jgi:hypothetical protein
VAATCLIALTWEGPTTVIGSLAVVALVVLLVLHEPRNSRIRIGIFLERRSDKDNDNEEGDTDGT